MSDRPGPAERPRLLYVVTEDWFFASHFLPMARAAIAAGFDVIVATRVNGHGGTLEREGIRVVPMQFERSTSTGLPLQVMRLARVMRRERPVLVHCMAVRSIVAGGLAARLAGIDRLVLAPTGLGHLWTSHSRRASAARKFVRGVIGRIRGPNTIFLFENHDDPADLGVSEARGDRIAFIGGAGVEAAAFPVRPLPSPRPLRIAVVSRMLRSKGIAAAVEAVRIARAAGVDVELELVGSPDRSNPSSIDLSTLEVWAREPGVTWRGGVVDVSAVWARNHLAMLLSVREGLPRALVEGMASGRAVITTDVPGCRELVRSGVEGFVVPPGDPATAAKAIAALAEDPSLLAEMGAAARRRFEDGFTMEQVMARIAALYRELWPRPN